MSWIQQFNAPIHLFQLMKGKVKDRGDTFSIGIYSKKDFSAKIQIFEHQTNEAVLETDIRSALNVQFSTKERRVFFDVNYNEKLYNFSLYFFSGNELRGFIRKYTICLIEITTQVQVDETSDFDIERFELYMSLDDLEVEEHEYKEPTVEYTARGRSDTGRNTLLSSSEKTLNSLVLRRYPTKCSLGMFELDKDCKFKQAIPTIETDLGDALLVRDMLTINLDKDLMLLDERNDKTIYHMDLVRGSIVSNYNTAFDGAEQPVIKLMPAKADMEESTFLGFNTRNVLRFDPRVESLVEKSEYKTDNKFTCGATSVNGKLAMGSRNGVIRLYSKPCKNRATTNFQANVGDQPIKSIDISPDEEWVVAVSPYYLSLINTKNQINNKLAFDAPMGKEKPPCIRLNLSQEHQQIVANYHNGVLPEFSTAKFELLGARIVSIVGSIGTAIVSWDFKRIKSGKRPTYTISFVGGEAIVDDKPIEVTRDVLFMSDNQLAMINLK
jgi:hypothetical protein